MVALGVALLSPLDALAGALASAHMVQHVLLLLVAAPLLALSALSSTIPRSSPLARRAGSRWRRRPRAASRQPARPAPAGHRLAAACRDTVVLARRCPLRRGPGQPARPRRRARQWPWLHGQRRIPAPCRAGSPTAWRSCWSSSTAMSVFLSAPLTFARTPWYAGYERTTRPAGPGAARRPAAGRGYHVDPGRRDLPCRRSPCSWPGCGRRSDQWRGRPRRAHRPARRTGLELAGTRPGASGMTTGAASS